MIRRLRRGITSCHLAALAAETTSIELYSLVSPVTFRHPGSLYKMAVTIDEISGGRFTLGLGAGWLEEEFVKFGLPYPDLRTRMACTRRRWRTSAAAITPGPVRIRRGALSAR